jgi:hypothetical protein
MAVLDFNKNALFGENGTGKLYFATNWTGTTYDDGDGTNEDEAKAALAALTYADIGYFENFEPIITNGEERIINTDYCDVGEIMRKIEKVGGFSVDVQEILEMSNLATILGAELNTTVAGTETIGFKRKLTETPYVTFKFVTCPKDGVTTTFYFVKAVRTGDISMPVTNLKTEDFAGVTLEFEIATGGNMYISKVTA